LRNDVVRTVGDDPADIDETQHINMPGGVFGKPIAALAWTFHSLFDQDEGQDERGGEVDGRSTRRC